MRLLSRAPAIAPAIALALRLAGLTGLATASACLPGSGPPLSVYEDDAGPPPNTNLGDDGGAARSDVNLGDPFSITGLAPSRGPWNGGTRTVIRGRGFSSKLRVWIGQTELVSSAIFASDPTRAAITTPPGAPGPADVRIRDDASATERILPAGFFYDAFVVEPNSGATSGGTRVAITGSGTTWSTGTTVAMDGKPCTDLVITDATHMSCVTPAGTPGAKDVKITNANASFDHARDAFTYGDSNDGYRGGLSGGALSGSLRVLAFDAWTGVPLVGGKAIAGGNIATALVATVNGAGVAQLSNASLTGKVTVTVAAKCHMPITFADVPVDTVTVYLTPVMDPACAGDPPSSGNFTTRYGGVVEGELVWPGGQEFKRAGWLTVPEPTRPSERRAAYVFGATGYPLDTFYLPAATEAITPASGGQFGYTFSTVALPGNLTFYALAGIEDRSVTPPRFTPYVMGVVRGVPVAPSTTTTHADIPMTTLLDHQVRIAPQPPAPTSRGPDRLVSQLAVTLSVNTYAILPPASAMRVSPLPVAGNVALTGVPALDGALSGESYSLTAQAATGQYNQIPASIVTRVRTTDSNNPVTLGGFLPVPTPIEPTAATWSGKHVAWAAGTGVVDLMVMNVRSGGGLVSWTIVAPATSKSFDVPDLSGLPDNVGLVRGPIVTTVNVARIDGFSYAKLRNGQLGSGAWNAYAIDAATGSY